MGPGRIRDMSRRFYSQTEKCQTSLKIRFAPPIINCGKNIMRRNSIFLFLALSCFLSNAQEALRRYRIAAKKGQAMALKWFRPAAQKGDITANSKPEKLNLAR